MRGVTYILLIRLGIKCPCKRTNRRYANFTNNLFFLVWFSFDRHLKMCHYYLFALVFLFFLFFNSFCCISHSDFTRLRPREPWIGFAICSYPFTTSSISYIIFASCHSWNEPSFKVPFRDIVAGFLINVTFTTLVILHHIKIII
jgi:hypothetical protein